MAFIYKGQVRTNGGRVLVGGEADTYGGPATLFANSEVVVLGNAYIADSAGNLVKVTAGDAIFGILVGVYNKGAYIAPDSNSLTTWTVEGDNITDKQVYGICDISTQSIYSAPQDGTIDTTANSGDFGAYIDVPSSDATQLDESTATRTRGTGGQFLTVGTDPEATTRILCVINESEWCSGT